MTKLLLMFLFCAVPMEIRTSATYSVGCPTPYLENGRAKVRTRTRSVIYMCSPHFELVGSRYATCKRGLQWDEPTPICVRPGCQRPSLKNQNTMAIPSHDGAWYMFFCYPGYKLIGSPAIYCNGHAWNTTTPVCVPDSTPNHNQQTSCDFESTSLCGWMQDEMHDFDWERHNLNTPSSYVSTGPSYDHTFGKGKTGYYMYIESTSKRSNDSARLVSPMFDSSLTKNGCFSFFYHMYGGSIGGLRVYQIADNQHILNMTEAERPELLLFEKWGEQGNSWFRNVSKLREMDTDFQIVIEGIRGSSFTSDIAIDDVAILQGEQCADAAATAVTPPTKLEESCAGRCDLHGAKSHAPGCGCSANCLTDNNCCADFFETCVFSSPSKGNDGDNYDDPLDAPRTEKLIRSPTTTTSTQKPTTTRKPTTKTVRTTVATTTIASKTSTTRPTTVVASTKIPKPPTTVKITKSTSPPPKSTMRLPTTRVLTTRLATEAIPTTKRQTTSNWRKLEADKARKEKEIEAKKVVTAKPQGPLVATLALAALLAAALAALAALRPARAQAALARLRGRAARDPEVRYLTRDDD